MSKEPDHSNPRVCATEESEVGQKEVIRLFSQPEKTPDVHLKVELKTGRKWRRKSRKISWGTGRLKSPNEPYSRRTDRKRGTNLYSVRHSVREGDPKGKPKGQQDGKAIKS